MNVVRAVAFRIGLLSALLASAVPASAQVPEDDAAAGGGVPAGVSRTGRRLAREELLRLDLSTTVSGSDTAQNADFPGAGEIPSIDSRYYADVQGSLRLQPSPLGRLSYGVNVQSAVRRYETSDEFMILGHSAGGNTSVRIGNRLSLSGFGSFSYLPSYSLNTSPRVDFDPLATAAGTAGLLPAGAVDYSLAKRTATSVAGGGGLGFSITRRMQLSMSYQNSLQDFKSSEDPSLGAENMSAGLSYRLSRLLGLRAGFQRRIADYARPTGIDRNVIDDVTMGLDSGYGRSISLTRSTSLSFDTGTNLAQRNGIMQADLTGRLSLAQRIGRQNSLGLTFSRGAELREGFAEPVFSNAVAGTGQFTIVKSLTAQASASSSLGNSMGEARSANDVRSYAASARLSYQMGGRAQMYAMYLISGHLIGENVEVIEGVMRDHSNRTLRVGLSWGLPLWTRIQRAPAARGGDRATSERN